MLVKAARSQQGFTLVELLVASVVGLIVMTALTSVVFTSWRGWLTAAGRVEASSQIRSFESLAHDDFTQSGMPPVPSGCVATQASPCTVQAIALTGSRATNAPNPAVNVNYHVTYVWDGKSNLDRIVGGNAPVHAATGVTGFSWYLAGTGSHETVVVTLSVTEQSYTETQTLQFYPRLN